MTVSSTADSNWYWTTINTGTATTVNTGYTITIPTTITLSGSGLWNAWGWWNGNPWTGSQNPTKYGTWRVGTGSSPYWEEHVPDSKIPVMSKKEIYIVREEYNRPYDLYDWIKLNMWEKEGKIERYWGDWSLNKIPDWKAISGSWI